MFQKYIAFDIGFRNFAFSVIEWKDGDWNIKFMSNKDLMIHSTEIFWDSFHQYLISIGKWIDDVEFCMIEKQMGFGGRVNYKAIQMASHLMAHILLYHPTKAVVEYPSSRKTKVFKVHYEKWADRKHWAVTFVEQLCRDQGDEVALEWLQSFPKKDDICDTILMILSYIEEKKKLNDN